MQSIKSYLCAGLALSLLPSLAMATGAYAALEENQSAAPPAFASTDNSAALGIDELDNYRGGDESVSNSTLSTGTVSDATAVNVATGWNTITDGAFAHASGLPIVIQNSGANVLIQNSTIVNVQFK